MRKILNGLKILIKTILLCLIAIIIVLYCSSALRVKKIDFPNDTSNKVSGFYALEKDSIDVLFMGTSHSYYAFNPGVFYEKTGLNSYVFAGECQPIGVTYHYLVEALKTQKPKIVVLDLFSLLPSAQGCQTDGIIQKNLEDLKMSENKFKALDLLKNENDRFNAKFDLMLYKNRWSIIEEDEWLYPLTDHFNYYFGFTSGWPGSDELFERPVYTVSDQLSPEEIQLNYLKKIVALTQEKEIDLILFKTPFYENLEDYKTMNMLNEFAQLYNIPLLDMNQDYSKYDFRFDEDGDVWHCNIRGAIKVTKFIAEYINENYSLSSAYKDLYKKEYEQLHIQTMRTLLWSSCLTTNQLANLLKYTDFTLIVSDLTTENFEKDAQILATLNKIGIDLIELHDYNYLTVISNGKTIEHFEGKGLVEYEMMAGNHYIYFNSSQKMHTFVDDKMMTSENDGINLIIIDNETDEILAIACIGRSDYITILF